MIFLENLRNATGAQLFGEVVEQSFSGIAYEATEVRAGDLFVSRYSATLRAEREIALAIERGAAGILCETPPTTDTSDLTVVVVGNVLSALGQWASYRLTESGATVICVVGRLGKSGTASAIASILGSHYNVHHDPDMESNQQGIPKVLTKLTPEHEVVILELSAQHPTEMREILAMIQPTIGVVTNLEVPAEWTHMESSLQESLEEFVAFIPESGFLVLNYDDNISLKLGKVAKCNVLTYGQSKGEIATPADFQAFNVRHFIDRVEFDLKIGQERHKDLWTSLNGAAGVRASLAGIVVGALFELPIDTITKSLSQARMLPGRRMVLEGIDDTVIVDDSFDSNPYALLSAINWIDTVRGEFQRLVLVLGDLDDYHPSTSSQHLLLTLSRRLTESVDQVIGVGDFGQRIARNLLTFGFPADNIALAHRKKDVIRATRESLSPGDIVLIVGTARSQMERVAEGLLLKPEDSTLLPVRVRDWSRDLSKRQIKSTWIEIDLEELAHNVQTIKGRLATEVKLIAVVSGNAYGHGVVPAGMTAYHNGADMLAVSTAKEGHDLRESGVSVPVLVMGQIHYDEIPLAIKADLILSVYEPMMVDELLEHARELNKVVTVHIKVDTGLGRLGLQTDQLPSIIRKLTRSELVKVQGIFSQFSVAENPVEVAHTTKQLEEFKSCVAGVQATGVKLDYIHIANSAAFLDQPDSHLTAVRIGLLIYGLNPSALTPAPAGLKRVLTWKTRVTSVKEFEADTFVGYGNNYRTRGRERIAVIPVGFADGFPGGTRNWTHVLVKGNRANIVERPGMDYTLINVTGIEDILPGDEVVLIGKQGQAEISVADVALRLGISNYEVVSSIPVHVPRFIRTEGRFSK